MRRSFLLLSFILLSLILFARPVLSQEPSPQPITIKLGDTWAALALRFNMPLDQLLGDHGSINPYQQPVIGQQLLLPQRDARYGRLLRPLSGGLLQIAARERQSPWTLTLNNALQDPYHPLLLQPLLLEDEQAIPRDLPPGFDSLTLSPLHAVPGESLLLWGTVHDEIVQQIQLENSPWIINKNDDQLLALTATGAFFEADMVLLTIEVQGRPLWSQPWQFNQRGWNYEQIEFQSMPATDPQAMRDERERLQEIWSQVSPTPLWQGAFQMPIEDYVEITSNYGARRSINGGAYDSYHEGTDFSAYGGTPVLAPAGARVVVAENLTVRGGTVILDHGLGIHSGYYHLSEIDVKAGEIVEKGQQIGGVGSTGRSTGNHLHWDLLIGTTWIDAQAFLAEGIPAKIRVAWGAQLPPFSESDIPRP